MSEQQRLLTVENLRVTFDIMPRNAWPWTLPQPLKAVNNVSFTLNEGETLGIVGESGCGKSTLARAIMGMVPSQAGKVVWLGRGPAGAQPKTTAQASPTPADGVPGSACLSVATNDRRRHHC